MSKLESFVGQNACKPRENNIFLKTIKPVNTMDNEKELMKVIEKGESERVEFKKSTAQMDRALKAMCSFLNHKGGVVYFGISDKNELICQDVSDSTLKSISQKIRQKIKPEVSPGIKVWVTGGKKVIEVKVAKGTNKPYYLDGIAYKRAGSESPVIAPDELEKIIQNKHDQEFDSNICRGSVYGDIDLEAVDWFRRKYREISGKELYGSNADVLKSLNCVVNEGAKLRPTNAGILLFGKNPAKFFPRYYVTVARYPGKDIGTAYLEIKDIEGNLFNIIDSAEEYINEYTESLYRLKKGQVARERIPQYPEFVIRELISNAVSHRDYSIGGSKTIIKMYKDRIEFDSPGGFGGNVNEKNILEEQYSRNPVIVKSLNKIRYIEEMGEGWNRIFKEVMEYSLKFSRLPQIKGNSRVVATIFSPEMDTEKDIEPIVSRFEPIVSRLNERQKKALRYMIRNRKMTSTEYAMSYKVSVATAKRDLNELVKKNIFEITGKGKATFYVLSGRLADNKNMIFSHEE